HQPVTGREPVTATGAGAGGVDVGVGVGAGVVGGGVTVVGVAVGVSWQVQVGVGDDGDDCGPEGPPGVATVDDDAVGLGDVDASAELETNITVKLVAASAMLASPAIFARLVSFNAVTRCLLAAGKSGAWTVGAQAGRSACHRAAMPWCPTSGTPERNAIER
ncbi:MAG: hypothetical protein WAN00_26060, partial [Trebonia sp.]